MNIKKLLYFAFISIFLSSNEASANIPFIVNGEEIPESLSKIARELLNVGPNTTQMRLDPTKFQELKKILEEYKQILLNTNQAIAVSRKYWIELQKTRIL